jgi:hypothetical protein
MAVNRRAFWVGAILIAAIVAVIVVRSTGDSSSTATRPNRPAPQTGRAAADGKQLAAAQTPVDINLEALALPRGEPAEEGRNPFRFQPKAPPPPPPEPPAPSPKTMSSNASAEPMVPVVPAGPPPPPPIPLKFIGIVGKADGTKIAVLSDGRKTHHGIEGQDIDGRYRILKIGAESVEIAYIDGRGRQTIRLTGQ